jgi:type IV pilus assembly protein PilM
MQLLGLHLEKKVLTLALVREEKKHFQLKHLSKIYLDDLEEVKVLLTKLVDSTTWMISTLETNQVLLRHLEMVFKKRSVFFKTLPFQLDQLIPYPLEEGIVVSLFEKRSFMKKPDLSKVMLLCLHERTYQEHVLFYQKHYIDPDWIGYAPQALYRFVHYYTGETTCTILHMGQDATHLVVMIDGGLSQAVQIDLGKEHFFNAIQLDRGFLTTEEADQFFIGATPENTSQEKFPEFFNLIKKFTYELDRVFYFLMQKHSSEKLDRFVFLKEVNFLKRFIEVLEKTVGTSLYFVETETFYALAPYAIPIGLAIDGFAKDGKKVQFKKSHEMTLSLKNCLLKKMGKYALACLVCSVCMFFSSQLFLKAKEEKLHKQLSCLFENYGEEVPIFQKNELKQSLVLRLKQAEKHLSKIKKPYGYYLTPTSVTSFLEKFMHRLQLKEGLQLEELEYTLQNYPSLEHPEVPYAICIRCVVSTLKQNLAETFFKELQAQQLLEEEPHMNITKQDRRYEALFYLKAN